MTPDDDEPIFVRLHLEPHEHLDLDHCALERLRAHYGVTPRDQWDARETWNGIPVYSYCPNEPPPPDPATRVDLRAAEAANLHPRVHVATRSCGWASTCPPLIP